VSIEKTEPRETPSKELTVTRLASVVGTIFLFLGIALYAVNNLGNRYFWGDEATSFLTSLGYPGVGQRSVDLSNPWSVIEGHIEPGMFNLLERFWALGFGTDIVSLRAYPFTLFVVYVVCLLLLSRVVKAPWLLGCAVVSLVLLENITPYYGVELRPSIAGLAATVALPLVAIWLTISKSKIYGLLIFIPVFMIFGSMQYNSFPIIIGVAGVLVVGAFKEQVWSKRIVLLSVALFSLIWLPFVYVLQVGNPFDLVGGDYFSNIPEAYLPNMTTDEALRTIFTNLFSVTALPRTLFLILLPIAWIVKRAALPTRESDRGAWGINALWITVFLGTTMSFLAGILGFLPWILGTRWSISEVGLIALSLVGLAGLISSSRLFGKISVRVVVLGLSLVLCVVGAVRMATYERIPGFDWNATLESLLEVDPEKAFVDNWTFVELRYWVEYSGQYDQFRDAWVNNAVQVVGGMDKANAGDIETFFASEADRFLVRSESLLEGIEIPEDFRVERVESWGSDPDLRADQPVLLVRN